MINSHEGRVQGIVAPADRKLRRVTATRVSFGDPLCELELGSTTSSRDRAGARALPPASSPLRGSCSNGERPSPRSQEIQNLEFSLDLASASTPGGNIGSYHLRLLRTAGETFLDGLAILEKGDELQR